MIVQFTLHINPHFVQLFPFERRHSGILGRIANGEEHDQLLIFRSTKQPSQCWTTVEWGAGEGNKASPLDSGKEEPGGN